MRQKKTNKARFHFVLDKELLKLLIDIAQEYNTTISHIIGMILDTAKSFIEKADFTIINEHGINFGEGNLKMTQRIRITMSKSDKRMLFLLQDHFLLRSKAEILRHIIRKYFEKVKKYTTETLLKIKNRFQAMWEKLKENRITWEKHKVIHKKRYNIDSIHYVYDTAFNQTKILYYSHKNNRECKNSN